MSILNLYGKPGYKMNLFDCIKWWNRRRKFKWQRAHWGFSAYDTWDMDHYLAELIAEMLLYKAKHDAGYPADSTPEEWQQWLIDTAALFKEYGRELPESKAYEAFLEGKKTIKNEDGSITVEYDEELTKAWFEDEAARNEYKMYKLRRGFEKLTERYENLWD